MTPRRRRSTVAGALGAVICVVSMLALVPPRGAQAAPGGGAAAAGGTAYWAEEPGESPNWIFPFVSKAYYSTANVQQFQQLMYRPLYWMTSNGTIGLDRTDSLADPPVYSHGSRVVTIDLKGWTWSNGTVVDAQDVVFFLNMLRAEEANWYGYLAGELPDNIVSVTAPSPGGLTVAITFDRSYSTRWLLDNELSQITPMPLAWDISKLVGGKPAPAGSGGCSAMTWSSSTERHCQAVWRFMSDDNGESSLPKEAGDLSTYATNPLWKIVDGPWRLQALSHTGGVTMVPNPDYGGTDKPQLAKFVELPYGSYADEYEAVFNGDVSVGFVPDGTTQSSPYGNLDEIVPDYPWGVNYIVDNFDSNGDHDRARYLFRQLYIRQALQELVDQPEIVSGVFGGDAVADDGPVPATSAATLLSGDERDNLYPYDPSKTIALLRAHGWTIHPGGTSLCTAKTGCGALVPTGTKLALRLAYTAGGSDSLLVADDVAGWLEAGVDVTPVPKSFEQTIETATPCRATQPNCGWEMALWGGGWLYLPDLYPTGDVLFETGSASDDGSYSSPANDTLVAETLARGGSADFLTWEDYAAVNLPVIWQPEAATVLAITKDLEGVTPLSPLLTIQPEDWHFQP